VRVSRGHYMRVERNSFSTIHSHILSLLLSEFIYCHLRIFIFGNTANYKLGISKVASVVE
jgi:hypothetical protein